jgi:hypothetical protein
MGLPAIPPARRQGRQRAFAGFSGFSLVERGVKTRCLCCLGSRPFPVCVGEALSVFGARASLGPRDGMCQLNVSLVVQQASLGFGRREEAQARPTFPSARRVARGTVLGAAGANPQPPRII